MDMRKGALISGDSGSYSDLNRLNQLKVGDKNSDGNLRKVAQELGRQVVDDAIADVLEQLAGGGLARAGQATDDRDTGLARISHQRPERATSRIVSSLVPLRSSTGAAGSNVATRS